MLLAKRSLPLFLMILAEAVWAGQEHQAVERRVYVCPAWESAVKLTDVEKYATKEEYVAACDSRYVLEKVRYRSDGLAVIAYFYHPRKSEGMKRPVIVFNRGSYVREDIALELLPMFHRLAKDGFAVVAPMYRGSDGGEGRDETRSSRADPRFGGQNGWAFRCCSCMEVKTATCHQPKRSCWRRSLRR